MLTMLCVALPAGLLLVLLLGRAWACTTVLVGKGVSETGEVLVGHNEDSGGRYVMRTHIVPAVRHATQETIRFEPKAAELPLPLERPKLFWSEARPFIPDGGASFCDLYVNGNGVVLCSDNCGKPKEDRPELTEGGIGYGIRRLTAERAKSAYNAVEVATELLDRYGYIGNGRSYHFADKDEIWVLQVVNGKHYAVKRVPDDHVYVNPNHYTIRQPDSGTPGLEELVAYAAKRGWYDPARGVFDFARAYQAPEAYRSVRNLHRHLRGLEIILGQSLDPEADLPFSVVPTRKIGVEDVKKVLRCHFENTSADVSEGQSPHFMETRPICAGTTLESTVVQIRENHDMTLIRRALGRPCFAPYVPWYFGMTAVPTEYGNGKPEEAVRTHFSVAPEDLNYTAAEAWFHHTDLQAAADPLYAEKAGQVREALMKFEGILENEIRYFEPLAAGHFKTDPDKARGLLTGSVSDWTGRALRKLDKTLAALGVLALDVPTEIDVNDEANPLVVCVSLRDLENHPDGNAMKEFGADDIALERTLFGPHYAAPSKWSKAVNAAVYQGQLCLSFRMGEWTKNSTPCLTDMWMTLENKKGRRLVGKALSRLSKELEPARGDGGCAACG